MQIHSSPLRRNDVFIIKSFLLAKTVASLEMTMIQLNQMEQKGKTHLYTADMYFSLANL